MKIKATVIPDGWEFTFDCYYDNYGFLESDETIILEDGTKVDIDYGMLLFNGSQEGLAGKQIKFEEIN